MKDAYPYRCPHKSECKHRRNCFILKTEHKLKEVLEIIYKCPAVKCEVPMKISPDDYEK
jgi:hypothetical protein